MTEPTDKSMPPLTMTMVMPMETIISMEASRISSFRLEADRKLPPVRICTRKLTARIRQISTHSWE